MINQQVHQIASPISFISFWLPPPGRTFKLNFDGAVWGSSSGGIGGLIRDTHGNMVIGFAERIEATTILHAEIMALLQGIRLCLEKNIKYVIFECDSLNLLMILKNQETPGWEEVTSWNKVADLLEQFFVWDIFFCPREANETAYKMARLCPPEPWKFEVEAQLPDYIYNELKMEKPTKY